MFRVLIVLVAGPAVVVLGKVGSIGLCLNPSLDEFASRAIRMFSCDKMFSSIGESVCRSSATVLLVVSLDGCRDGLALWSGDTTPPIFGVSFTIGEYCEMGDEPLKAPVGVGGSSLLGGGARLPLCIVVASALGPPFGGLLVLGDL